MIRLHALGDLFVRYFKFSAFSLGLICTSIVSRSGYKYGKDLSITGPARIHIRLHEAEALSSRFAGGMWISTVDNSPDVSDEVKSRHLRDALVSLASDEEKFVNNYRLAIESLQSLVHQILALPFCEEILLEGLIEASSIPNEYFIERVCIIIVSKHCRRNSTIKTYHGLLRLRSIRQFNVFMEATELLGFDAWFILRTEIVSLAKHGMASSLKLILDMAIIQELELDGTIKLAIKCAITHGNEDCLRLLFQFCQRRNCDSGITLVNLYLVLIYSMRENQLFKGLLCVLCYFNCQGLLYNVMSALERLLLREFAGGGSSQLFCGSNNLEFMFKFIIELLCAIRITISFMIGSVNNLCHLA